MKKSHSFLAALPLLIWCSLVDCAMAQTQPPVKTITISLPEPDWNVVLKALGKLPLEESAGAYQSIINQAQAQLKTGSDSLAIKPKIKNK